MLPSMGSEYATGEGSSFVSAGKEPVGAGMGGGYGVNATLGGGGGGRKRSGTNANAGMAKAVVNNAMEWVSETGEVMGLWKGEKTRHSF